MGAQNKVIAEVLQAGGDDFLTLWLVDGLRGGGSSGLTTQSDARSLLDALRQAVQVGGDPAEFAAPAWAALRDSTRCVALVFSRTRKSGNDSRSASHTGWTTRSRTSHSSRATSR